MTVLVTGGTGYLGSHTVAAIRRAGHPVRLLVRDPARIRPALAPHGLDPSQVSVVAGDVTDPSSVAAATRGVSAVVHAASVYSFDPRSHPLMDAVNVRGTELVLAAARAAGADPIVHVSTFGALLPTADDPVTPRSPVGAPREKYLASKASAELVARRHQDEGAPVVITCPPALLGPHDPYLGDQTRRIRDLLRGLMPIWPRGGFPIGDVRDAARLHAALLQPGLGPRRFLGQGRYVDTAELIGKLRALTGRRLPTLFLPAVCLLPAGVLAGAAQRIMPGHVPVEYGAIYTCRVGRRTDTSDTDRLLGSTALPLEQTLGDTVRWLVEAGHLGGRWAGRAA